MKKLTKAELIEDSILSRIADKRILELNESGADEPLPDSPTLRRIAEALEF